MNKFKSLVLAVMGLLCCMSVSAHDFEVDGIYYDITSSTNKTVAVTYRGNIYDSYSDEYSGEVKIPESVTYSGNTYSVTSIGYRAFIECDSLTSVTIPNNVTSIGDEAFSKCVHLSSITIGSGLESIGNNAFYYCTNVKSITLNTPNVRTWFSGVFSIKTVVLGNNVTSIEDYAFEGCSNVESIIIGTGVLSIGSNQCTPKKAIWLTNTPPSGWSNLEGTINYVANDQYGKTDNVKVYPYLSSMFEVDGVRYVPISPSERTCDAIDCNYDPTIESIHIDGTVLYRGVSMTVQNVMPYLAYGQNTVKNVSISNKGYIGEYAFYGCRGISNAIISNDGSIGIHAFEGAMTATNAVLNITSKGGIGSYAFNGCTGLVNAKVAIEEAVEVNTVIPMAFDDWISTNQSNNSTSSKTYTITTPSATILTFEWWVSSESSRDFLVVTLNGTKVLSKSGSDSGIYTTSIGKGDHTLEVRYTKDGRFSSGEDRAKIFNVKVEDITPGTIGNKAFGGCSLLSTLTLGKNVISIGKYAFQECKKLTAVQIPNKATKLDNYCFSGTSALKTVDLGSGVQTIGENCFDGSGIPSISIPASVTQIGNYAFDNCTKLADVVIADRTTDLTLGSNGSSPLFSDCPLDSVYIGGNISYNTSSSYGYSPFYRNTSLRTVVITDKEEEISDNEFYGCTNLKNVTIGSDVKKIGNWAFSGCSNLDYFSFGKSVETIGQEAFSDCVNLTKLISYAEVPPTCGTMALDDINKWNCVLQVPQSCLAAYQQANQWKEFFFIEDVLTAIGGVTVDGTVPATADVYSTNGMLIKRNADLKNLKHELPAGIYIIGGKKVWVK